MKVFDKYSLYYDLLYQDKDYDAEVDYIHQLLTLLVVHHLLRSITLLLAS